LIAYQDPNGGNITTRDLLFFLIRLIFSARSAGAKQLADVRAAENKPCKTWLFFLKSRWRGKMKKIKKYEKNH